MTDVWDRETLVAAVRGAVPHVPDSDDELPAQVTLDGDDVLITFRWPGEPHLFGVRVPLAQVPEGPSTGEVCESAEEWAWEVSLLLAEELGTGLVRRGRRTVTPQGIVELDHRSGIGELEPPASPGPPPPGHHHLVRLLPDEPAPGA